MLHVHNFASDTCINVLMLKKHSDSKSGHITGFFTKNDCGTFLKFYIHYLRIYVDSSPNWW